MVAATATLAPDEVRWDWEMDARPVPSPVSPVSSVPFSPVPFSPGPAPSRLADIVAGGTVKSGGDIGVGSGVLPEADLLPALPALADLLPAGALQRGTVVATGEWGLLALALAAGPVASGAWCAVAGLPHLGVCAAAEVGLDPDRLLLIGDLGQNWPQVVASLLDGCDLVLLLAPERVSAQVRRRLEAAVRRYRSVLLVVGEWDGAQTRLRVVSREWTGIGAGHGRLRARRARVVADGRGGWSRPRERWLWLPGPDGTVSAVTDGCDRSGLAGELADETVLAGAAAGAG